MRLLVLGGTVFLGRHVVAAALRRGDEVTVLSRGRHGRPPPGGVTWLRGDRIEDLPRLTAGGRWDAVVDTSAYTPEQAEAAGRALRDRTAHYAFVSTANVHPGWPAEPIDEGSPVWEDGEGYGPDKARAERRLEAALPGRVAHVRCGLLCGPHDATLRLPWWVDRIARGGEVVAPGRPEATVQLIDARDLAAWTLGLAERGVTGPIAATAPPGVTTFAEVLEAAVGATGSGARLHWVPDAALLAAGIEPWTGLPLWVPDADGWRGTWRIATDRAQAEGLAPRPIAATVADTAAWLAAGGAATLDDWGSHARPSGLTPEQERELLALG